MEELKTFLLDAAKDSEQQGVRHGTAYIESEYEAVKILKAAAQQVNGDITDVQWFAGLTSLMGLFYDYCERSIEADLVITPLLRATGPIIGRLYIELEQEGVKLFG